MKNIEIKKFITDSKLPIHLCELYVSLLFIVQPLLVHNGYFDITATKTYCFIYLTLAFLAPLCLLLVLRREKPKTDLRSVLFCLFAGMLVISSLLMQNAGSAWLGEKNRYQGILSNLLYALLCLALCRYGSFGKKARTAMLTGFAFVSALAVLNHLGIDLFGFIGRLRTVDRARFISTIGNINPFSAYVVLLLPICVSFALRESCAHKRGLLWLLSVLGLWAAMAGRCESAVLGIGAAVLLMPVFLGDDAAALRRFPLLLPGEVIAAELYSLVAARCGATLSELTAALLSPYPALSVSALGIVLWLTLRKKDDRAVMRMRKAYCVLLAVLLVLCCVFAVLANTALSDRLGGVAGKYAVIDDDWGSDRGKIWKSFLEMFAESSPLEKLIGGGAGSVVEWDKAHRVFVDAVTDAAHNEYLHYLLTNGLLGLSAYVLFLCLTAQKAVRSSTGRCLLSGCAAYAVQAVVNIAQPMTTPLFFVLLFLCGSEEPIESGKGKRGLVRISVSVALAIWVLAVGAVNGAPRPLSDPSAHETESTESLRLYTSAKTYLYLLPGGSVYAELPPRTALDVTGRTGEWMQVKYDGMTLYVRGNSLVPASELGIA